MARTQHLEYAGDLAAVAACVPRHAAVGEVGGLRDVLPLLRAALAEQPGAEVRLCGTG
jgi:hypothetical protein